MSGIVGLDGRPANAEPAEIPVAEQPAVPPEDIDFEFVNDTFDGFWIDGVEAKDSADGKQHVWFCWGTMIGARPHQERRVQSNVPTPILKVPLQEKGRIEMTDLRATMNKMWRETHGAREEAVSRALAAQTAAIAAAKEAAIARNLQLRNGRKKHG